MAKVSESISDISLAPSQTKIPSRTQLGSSVPSETGAGGNGGNSDKSGSGSTGGGGNKVAIIAASVLGAVVAIALVVGLIWFFRRRNQRKRRGEPLPGGNADTFPGGADPSKYPNHGAGTSIPELSTPSHTPRPELQGNATALPSELPPHHWPPKSELQGDGMHGQHLRPTQSPHELMSPTSGYQVSPQSAGPPSYSSPVAVSPNHGHHTGYWGPQGTEAYELGTNMHKS